MHAYFWVSVPCKQLTELLKVHYTKTLLGQHLACILYYSINSSSVSQLLGLWCVVKYSSWVSCLYKCGHIQFSVRIWRLVKTSLLNFEESSHMGILILKVLASPKQNVVSPGFYVIKHFSVLRVQNSCSKHVKIQILQFWLVDFRVWAQKLYSKFYDIEAWTQLNELPRTFNMQC